MKTVLRIFFITLMFMGALNACKNGNNEPGIDPPVGDSEIVLTASKYSMYADGVDEITFTVKLDGEDVTAQSRIYISGRGPLDANVFTTATAGEYNFYAYYSPDGESGGYAIRSEEISITVKEEPGPTVFDPDRAIKKNVAFFNWATTMDEGGCYDLKVYMERVMADYGDNIVQVYLHTGSGDVISESTAVGLTIGALRDEGRFDLVALGGYPMSIVELRENLSPGYVPSEAKIRTAYNTYKDNSPRTGAMVGSTVTEAHQGLKGRVDATVTIGAKEAGDYSIGIFLVEDNVSAFQVGAPGSIYNHADIVRHLGTDLFGDAIGSMTAGQTIEKEFTMTIEDSYKLEDLSLVIYTSYKEGGYSVIDNIVKVPAAGQTGFNYAD